jgi:hypothetical protein
LQPAHRALGTNQDVKLQQQAATLKHEKHVTKVK